MQTQDLPKRIGDFLFKSRDVVFPVVFLAVYALFVPHPITSYLDATLLLGFVLVLAGQGIRVLTIGLAYIVRGGRKRKVYAEKLVVSGIFKHCRNPMYVGNILMVVGYFALGGNVYGFVTGTALFGLFYWLIVYSEERYLSSRFQGDYRDYQRSTPKWIPDLSGLRATVSDPGVKFDWPGVIVKEYGTIALSSTMMIALMAWRLQRSGMLVGHVHILYAALITVTAMYLVARYLKKSGKLLSNKDRHSPSKEEARA